METGQDRYTVIGIGAEQSIFDNEKQTTICKCFSPIAASTVCNALNRNEDLIQGLATLVYDKGE